MQLPGMPSIQPQSCGTKEDHSRALVPGIGLLGIPKDKGLRADAATWAGISIDGQDRCRNTSRSPVCGETVGHEPTTRKPPMAEGRGAPANYAHPFHSSRKCWMQTQSTSRATEGPKAKRRNDPHGRGGIGAENPIPRAHRQGSCKDTGRVGAVGQCWLRRPEGCWHGEQKEKQSGWDKVLLQWPGLCLSS